MNTVISSVFNELNLVPDQPFKYNNKSVEACLNHLYDDLDYIDIYKMLFKLDEELDVFYINYKGGWSRVYDASILKLILNEPSFVEPQVLLAEEFEFLSKFDSVEYIVKQDENLHISFEDSAELIIPIVTLKFDFEFMQSGTTYYSNNSFKPNTGES